MQYTEIFSVVKKIEKFVIKKIEFFLIFAQNVVCGYTLEPPRRGGSNEYPQSMFWGKIKKNRYTTTYPSFATKMAVNRCTVEESGRVFIALDHFAF